MSQQNFVHKVQKTEGEFSGWRQNETTEKNIVQK